MPSIPAWLHRTLLKDRGLTVGAVLALASLSPAALAVDTAWSGFATLGFARSDSDYTYQRFINRQGSLRRDSLLAGQLDLRLDPAWSATVQVKAATAEGSDHDTRTAANWAFVAWRPGNDWLLRAGRLRAPLYLHSESLDVGVSHDMARLPYEVYSISPTNDFNGLFATRSVSTGPIDYSVDAYAGTTRTTARQWLRDGVPGAIPAGAFYNPVRITVQGLVLTARQPDLSWRLGIHAATTSSRLGNGLPVTYPQVVIAPGLSYWQTSNLLPGPGVPVTDRIRNLVATGGIDLQWGQGWRGTAEFVRMHQKDSRLGSDSTAGYVALFRRIGPATPYASLAYQRSSDGIREWYQRLVREPLPGQLPGAAQINAAQRAAGESIFALDQRSLGLGMSWATSATAKLKFEWMRTWVGGMSTHFDTPAGQPELQHQHVDSLTVNLNVAF